MSVDQVPTSDALLRESEQRYREIIEGASDVIQSVRPDGTFEFVNGAWHRTLGYTPEELDGLIIWDIIHPDGLQECQAHFMTVMGGTNLEDVPVIFMDKQGNPIPFEGSAHSRFIDGKLVATHGIFRNISERVRAEKLQAEKEKLEREQQARYLEKMAALGKLSAGLSHELNNPAAAATRAAKLLAETLERREAATKQLIERGVSREVWAVLGNLVDSCAEHRREAGELSPMEASRREDELLDWLDSHGIPDGWNYAAAFVTAGVAPTGLDILTAQLPAGAAEPAVAWVGETLSLLESTDVIARSTDRISELVGAVKMYSFRDQATEQDVDVHDGLENTLVILAHQFKSMTVERDYDRTIPPIRTYGSGLNQVWTNILDNAADATNEEGRVTIKTRQDGDRVVVEITDNGPGIPEENLTKIFEPFFTTKAVGSGTGLGLDIVWRIVTDEHRGDIKVDSEPGRTTFTVSVPICPDFVAAKSESSDEFVAI